MAAGADPDLVLRLAKATANLYADAVAELLRLVARRLEQGIDVPGWAERKLFELAQLRQEALAEVARLEAEAAKAIRDAITHGHSVGQATAGADLRDIGATFGFGQTNTAAVDALVAETVARLQGTHLQILRHIDDAYRQVIAEASSSQVLSGALTRRQAAQRALDRFADQGITGFVDRAGRRWQLESYAEMATRTAVGRAQVQGSLDRYQANGKDLVIVSDAPEECPACRPWEGRVLSVSGRTPTGTRVGGMEVAGSVAQAVSAGLQHANCFPAEVVVSGPPVDAADARWYEGDLVVIHTAGGDELPVTPNHPVLTPEGWVAAGALHVGDHLVRHLDPEGMCLVGPDDQRVPARIGDVASALREAGPVVTMSVPASAEQFHGDGLGGQVDVVLAHRLLRDRGDAVAVEPCGHHPFVVGGVGLGALLAERPPAQVVLGAGHAPDGVVCAGDLSGALLRGHARPLPGLGLAARDAGTPDLDPATDRGLGDAEEGRELVLALAGSVALDQVVDLGRREFAGHVFNLQTRGGWYTANGIVVHNCRHRLGLFVPGLTRPMHGTADPEGYEQRQTQRRLERNVRRWKRREAVAVEDQARRDARRRRVDAQGRLRAFVAEHDRKRLPYRERIGAAI